MAAFGFSAKRMVWFWVLITTLWVTAEAGNTRIVLRDGTIEESERVWESERFVHFILKGTQTVEVRYAKEIVERIEQEPIGEPPKMHSPDPVTPVSPTPPLSMRPRPSEPQESPDSASGVAAQRSALPDRRMIDVHRNIGFYDPHRSRRYWASRESQHHSLHSALDALAKQYGQDRRWVIAHMGDENDLGLIHGNLIATLEAEITGVAMAASSHSADVTSAAVADATSAALPISLETDALFQGIAFYNPRRSKKYWSTPQQRHDSLQDAVASLAGMYGVSPDWVLDHMGDTNDLFEIHQQIQEHLNADRAR